METTEAKTNVELEITKIEKNEQLETSEAKINEELKTTPEPYETEEEKIKPNSRLKKRRPRLKFKQPSRTRRREIRAAARAEVAAVAIADSFLNTEQKSSELFECADKDNASTSKQKIQEPSPECSNNI
ncbi:hypothetical protein FWK35_00009556 [Aphis craccivora]|uniref:Uncharacterized protein n=1 Tax=Aphis craccivora TaxID=307492 RepID=A0A6G0Y364_APHCR|nr:hypothetical protein FWK35_00009556 [Aphis craccivora]